MHELVSVSAIADESNGIEDRSELKPFIRGCRIGESSGAEGTPVNDLELVSACSVRALVTSDCV